MKNPASAPPCKTRSPLGVAGAGTLAQLIETVDLRDVSRFGFSTGGGEIARYVGRHGNSRVARHGIVVDENSGPKRHEAVVAGTAELGRSDAACVMD